MDPSTASALARDPDTGSDALEMLCELGLPFLREYVAVHPNTPWELLERLAPRALRTENDVALARALTMNEGTPGGVLGRLLGLIDAQRVDGARRENWAYEELALRTMAHPNCPPTAAREFIAAHDLPRSFRCSLAQGVASVEVLETLANDVSEVVSAIAAERLRKLHETPAPVPN